MVNISKVELVDANTFNTTDDRAFENLFKANFKSLLSYASVMLYHDSHAEEIVQNVFVRIWEKRDVLEVQVSVKAYLYKCVHNDCLNYLKHKKIKAKYQEHTIFGMNDRTDNTTDRLILSELQDRLQLALNDLPEQCRTIFQMSRFDELKYREIADELGLSIKTVENQMGKALRILRLKLVDFLPILILFMHNDY